MLVVAVLWAQWLGLEHVVRHAFGPGHPQTQSSLNLLPSVTLAADADNGLNRIFGDADAHADGDQDSSGSHHHHSCAAFDTATLGASAPATPLAQALCPFTHIRAENRIPEFYLPLFTALFNSRAPPSFHPA